MKKITILLVLSLFYMSSVCAQASWEVKQSPVFEDLASVCFYDDDHGWVVSYTGTVLNTTDGGTTWNIHSFPDYHFESVHFPTASFGCIVGWFVESADSSLILTTSDGGGTWTEATHTKVNRLNDVYFENSADGWAVGTYDDLNLNCCLYTSDGGASWTKQMEVLVSGAELFGVHFRDEQVGTACGTDGAFLHTNSAGTTGWSLNISMPLVDLNALWNVGSQHGCAVGDEGTVLYTINDWYQHIDQTSGTTEDLYGVHAEPLNNKFWAVGNNGTIIHMSNYLLGWTSQASGTTEHLRDVCMLSETEGWAVGTNGTILHYTAETSIVEFPNNIQLTITPNPSDGILKVMLDSGQFIDRIEVIDILGQVGMTIIPGELRQTCTVDLTELQNGIYFVKVYSSRGFALKRLIINS